MWNKLLKVGVPPAQLRTGKLTDLLQSSHAMRSLKKNRKTSTPTFPRRFRLATGTRIRAAHARFCLTDGILIGV